MTTEQHKQPSCVHVAIVTVVAPFQVNLAGTVYHAGDTVVDVPKQIAVGWIANGWAEDASAKKPAAKAAAKR